MPTYQERDGRVRAIIRRKGQPSQSKSFDRKSDAVKWARKVEANLDAGGFIESKDSVASILERYRDEVTVHKRGWKWEQTRINCILELPWAQMKAADCADQLHFWAQRRRKEVSDATVHRELNVISAAFTHAMKVWRIKLMANPVSMVLRPPNSKARNRRVAARELEALWKHDRGVEHSIRWFIPIMAEFGIETALRLSEMCHLEWEHVHVDENYIFVEKSKNGDSRNVPLSPRAKELLEMLPRSNAWPFPTNEGSVGAIFRQVCKELGIKDLHFHDTRHEAISRLAKLYPILQLSQVSGHRSLKSLQVYYNPTIQELVQYMYGAAPPTPPRP